MSRRFDRAYYDRFYRDPSTRVAAPAEVSRLVAFVCSYLKHLDVAVHSVLDVGCGLGLWRGPLRRHYPRARYTGVEVSAYLCREYGWQRGSIVDYEADEPFDLVVCQGVLQYLRAREAKRAIRNLARLTGGALYLEALTREDWEEHCSREITDGDVYLREARWYRRELTRDFISCGGGVFVPRDDPPVLFELERWG